MGLSQIKGTDYHVDIVSPLILRAHNYYPHLTDKKRCLRELNNSQLVKFRFEAGLYSPHT